MSFQKKDVLRISDFSKEEILQLIKQAEKIDSDMAAFNESLKGKILATLFFEPSTRTRMSFQAAMQRMGGSVIGFSDVSTSSLKKGESLPDTLRIVSGYCDVIVMRHPKEGSVAEVAEKATVPIINAGDGSNEHPSQTLLDLYTIMKERDTLENLKVGFIGDLKHGRTVHSLVKAFQHFNPTFYFISPESLKLPESYTDQIKQKKIDFYELTNLLDISKELDVLYVTRIQKERFQNQDEYFESKKGYCIDKSIIAHLKEDAIILHPLPRVDEMDSNLDKFKQSVYFKQSNNGIPLRMALLGMLLGKVK